MSCSDVMQTICAKDVAGWMTEGRVDCPGRLWNSTIIQSDAEIARLANGKGWAVDHVFWTMAGTKADVDTIGVPNKDADCPDEVRIGQKSMTARRFVRTGRWGLDYLDGLCNRADEDEAVVIQKLIADWSLDAAELDLAHALRGIYLNNKAADSGDLVYDASDAATNHLPNFLTKHAVIEAGKILGCKRQDLQALLIHDEVMTSLEKRDLVTTQSVQCADGQCIERAYFMGKEIYAMDSDLLTVNGDGTGGFVSIVFRPGALAYGAGSMGDRALGTIGDECADGGMGSQSWITRDVYSIHPVGWDNTWDAAANNNEANEGPLGLSEPSNWCRVYEPQNVGLVFIEHTEAP